MDISTDQKNLNCREAQLLLTVIDQKKPYHEMNDAERSAIQHYILCEECGYLGLAKIRKVNIHCIDAILTWAQNPALEYDQKTLYEQLVKEHILGHGMNDREPCREGPCYELRFHATRQRGSSSFDPTEILINLFPALLNIFYKEKWPLDKLFEIQRNRTEKLLDDIENGEIIWLTGQYHHTFELITEIQKHIEGLQMLAIELAKS